MKQTYSKVCDAAQIFEIKMKILATKQGERSMTEYTNLLKNLWQEIDHYQCIQKKDGEDATIWKDLLRKKEFLHSLLV